MVPVDQGDLRDSIALSTEFTRFQPSRHRKFAPDDIEVFVGASPHPQTHMQEFGAEHSPPQPFMRPARETEKDGVLAGLKQDLWTEIDKSAQRLARKARR